MRDDAVWPTAMRKERPFAHALSNGSSRPFPAVFSRSRYGRIAADSRHGEPTGIASTLFNGLQHSSLFQKLPPTARSIPRSVSACLFEFLLAARHVRQKSPKISSIERALGKFQKRIRYYLMLMASSYRLPRWFEMILVRVRIACYSHHFEAHIAIMTFPLSNAIIPFSSNYSFAIRLNCVLQIVYKYHMTVADISGFNYFLHATLHDCCYKAKRTISLIGIFGDLR